METAAQRRIPLVTQLSLVVPVRTRRVRYQPEIQAEHAWLFNKVSCSLTKRIAVQVLTVILEVAWMVNAALVQVEVVRQTLTVALLRV